MTARPLVRGVLPRILEDADNVLLPLKAEGRPTGFPSETGQAPRLMHARPAPHPAPNQNHHIPPDTPNLQDAKTAPPSYS